jgi:hypothetical protein
LVDAIARDDTAAVAGLFGVDESKVDALMPELSRSVLGTAPVGTSSLASVEVVSADRMGESYAGTAYSVQLDLQVAISGEQPVLRQVDVNVVGGDVTGLHSLGE